MAWEFTDTTRNLTTSKGQIDIRDTSEATGRATKIVSIQIGQGFIERSS